MGLTGVFTLDIIKMATKITKYAQMGSLVLTEWQYVIHGDWHIVHIQRMLYVIIGYLNPIKR